MDLEKKLDYLIRRQDRLLEKEELRLAFNRYCLDSQCYKCYKFDEEEQKTIKAFCLLDWIIDNYNVMR